MDLTEAEDIKKRWQEYTEELHKKVLHDADNLFLRLIFADEILSRLAMAITSPSIAVEIPCLQVIG